MISSLLIGIFFKVYSNYLLHFQGSLLKIFFFLTSFFGLLHLELFRLLPHLLLLGFLQFTSSSFSRDPQMIPCLLIGICFKVIQIIYSILKVLFSKFSSS